MDPEEIEDTLDVTIVAEAAPETVTNEDLPAQQAEPQQVVLPAEQVQEELIEDVYEESEYCETELDITGAH